MCHVPQKIISNLPTDFNLLNTQIPTLNTNSILFQSNPIPALYAKITGEQTHKQIQTTKIQPSEIHPNPGSKPKEKKETDPTVLNPETH
ncbi:predicted protein [Botrytis cinerea T4]|uniref:Uncharacterized protein n=1 Tax=Botryotinia fuckeliana (strain T4) TaxID=999810 RepID=G2Y4A6_BOTF4|nr:predicted protein [Botrytis cinerea T4]